MAKKRLVIYASCQGETLGSLLLEKHPEAFEYQILPFYKHMAGEPLPDSIWDADIFLYQPLLNTKGREERRQYETDGIVRRLRQQGTDCYGFPFLHFNGYHPDFCHEPLNARTIRPDTPWGLFPYGMEAVMGLRGKVPVQEIILRSKSDDFLSSDYICQKADQSLAMLRNNEAGCDTKMADWVEANFREELLFHTVNHPTNSVLERLYRGALGHLGLPPFELRQRPELLGSVRPPLYPCVRRVMEISCGFAPALGGKEVTYEDYMIRYVGLQSMESEEEAYARLARCAVVLEADCPSVLAPADEVEVKLSLRNDSPKAWLSPGEAMPPVRISYHWLCGADVHTWDGLRTDLPRTVRPGDSVCVDASVRAPSSPGTYLLQWDLVIEGVTWFSSGGCTLMAHHVQVEESPAKSL